MKDGPPSHAPLPYGGQAVIEGVMMRGPNAMSVAVRAPDGQILFRTEITGSPLTTQLRRVPLVRGVVTLFETFSIGIRGLYWSSRVATGREDDRMTRGELALSVAVIATAAAVFIAGPVLATGWVSRTGQGGIAEVGAEGLLRIGMLIGYIWFVGRLPEVQRVFAYHGAEHRTIHAMEHGVTLTPEHIRSFPNAHPRCGTAFLLTVGIISLGLFMVLGTPSLAERIAERIILLPAVAALAYEFLRASQAWERHPILRVLQWPNLWLQRLTTRDPDDGQIEVAVAALNALLAVEATVPGTQPVPVEVESESDPRWPARLPNCLAAAPEQRRAPADGGGPDTRRYSRD
jgi:uncharacterized protein YqhQ